MGNTKDLDFPLLKSDVTQLVQEAVISTLEGNAYDHKEVSDWVTSVTSSCIDDLRRLSPNFKYIVTCFIRQRKGACVVSWENPTMSVVIAVYGIATTSSSSSF
ncbi:hypothetical protein Gpo141_00004682 [Globisporangium polare]